MLIPALFLYDFTKSKGVISDGSGKDRRTHKRPENTDGAHPETACRSYLRQRQGSVKMGVRQRLSRYFTALRTCGGIRNGLAGSALGRNEKK